MNTLSVNKVDRELVKQMQHCPFCGSDKVKITSIRKKSEGVTYYQGLCNKCYARGPKKHTELEAVKAWNIRDYTKEIKVDYLQVDDAQFIRFLSGDIALACPTFESYIALLSRCKDVIPNVNKDNNWEHTWSKYKQFTAAHAKSSIIDKDKLWFGFCYIDYYTEDEGLIVEDIIVREVYTNEK